MILIGLLREPTNYFCHYYRITLRPIALSKFEREENVGGASEGSLRDTDIDSISRELNEAMDINALRSGGHTRRKTSTGPKRKANSGGPIAIVTLIYSSPIANLPTIGKTSSLITINEDTPPLFGHEDSPVAPTTKRVPIKVVEDFLLSLRHLLSEVGTFGLRYIEAHDKELANTQVELDRVCELYNKVREGNEIINE
ncbi:hypothetical protein J1N35_034228 [Gossypium stocksii]|uniref:Uncharacterized protein n=1 Tax=Gossypium stocksii TaxID=47602 RepID=A0A9D3URL0_9ROSI|nr:hypothetical protein J1N35_034228 [Gossypium stocksii]